MRDGEVVASIVAGDPAGLAAAYDRYAPQLLAYCRSLLREPADAADAVRDTFVIAASRLKGLRDPADLRPWLYTVARRACLRKLKAQKAAAAIYLAAPGVAGSNTDVGVRAELADLRALVRDASAGLNAAEREILVLRLWQGMDAAEAATVVGVSRGYGSALFARARAQLEVCIGVLLLARTGHKDCARLSALLQGWDGQLDVLLRKRLSRHVDHCADCAERRRRELVPALVGLSAGAAIAGAAAADAIRQAAHAPVALRGQVLTAATGHIAASAALAAHAGDSPADAHPGDVPHAAHAGPAGAEEAVPGSSLGSFGQDGLGEATHTGARVTRAQVTAAACGVGAAAVLATVIALALSGTPQPGKLASGTSGGSPGTSGAAGATAHVGTPGSGAAGATGTVPGARPHGEGGLSAGSGAGSRGAVSGTSGAGVLGGGSPQPTSVPARAPSSATSSRSGDPGSGSPSSGARSSPSPSSPSPSSPSPSSPPPSSTAPVPGTLGVSARSIPLDVGGSATLVLTASGGPVSWSITLPSTLLGHLSVSKSSGTLAAGQSVAVTIKVTGLASLDTTLEVEPGGTPVTVLAGLGL